MSIIQIVAALCLSLVAPSIKAQSEMDELARALTVKLMAPDLVGGRKATEEELPMSQWLGFCSAAWVSKPGSSKGVIFTAAHCIDRDGQTVSFTDRKYKTQHRGQCFKHSRYNDQTVVNDFALCEITPNVKEGATVAEFDFSEVKVGDGLVMSGYGRNPQAGTLHLGASVVYAIRGQDIVTNTQVALTSGDSGHSLFRGPTDLVNGPFKIIGVNSRRAVGSVSSYMNQVTYAKDWMTSWASQKGAEICGLNAICKNKPNVIPDVCLADKEMVDYFDAELKMAKNAFDACVR